MATKGKWFTSKSIAFFTMIAAACLVATAQAGVQDSEEKAHEQAKAKDLPAIAKADRVTITAVSEVVTDVKDAKLVAPIIAELKVTDATQSAGSTEYTLTFYKDKEKIRTVWVYASGEWGVNPPEGNGWMCGKGDGLVKAIKAALAK
jgi:hypothetical protein